MSSVPVVSNQPVSAARQNASEGASLGEDGNVENVTEKQGGITHFTTIMRQLALNDKGGAQPAITADFQPGNVKADNPDEVGIESDGSDLPPSGILLPAVPQQAVRLDNEPGKHKLPDAAISASAGSSVETTGESIKGKNPLPLSKNELLKVIEKTPSTIQDSGKGALADINAFVSAVHEGGQQAATSVVSSIAGDAAVINHMKLVDTANILMPATANSAEKTPLNTLNTSINLPLQHPEWGDELGNRITWMVQRDVQSATIKINPPQLGPLEVKVSMVNDQVNVSFSSHHAPVREALDASLPRLREMLHDNGLQLGDANVAHRSFSEHGQTQRHGFSQNNGEFVGGSSEQNMANEDQLERTMAIGYSTGTIDLFA